MHKNSKIVGGSAMQNLHIATQVLNALPQKDTDFLRVLYYRSLDL
jgi:hypothetical protein